jgi:hypothetical protein
MNTSASLKQKAAALPIILARVTVTSFLLPILSSPQQAQWQTGISGAWMRRAGAKIRRDAAPGVDPQVCGGGPALDSDHL